MRQFDQYMLALENRYNKHFVPQNTANLRDRLVARKHAPIGPMAPVEPVKPVAPATDWEPREMTAQTPSIFRTLYGIIKNNHDTNLADAKAVSLDFLQQHRGAARFTTDAYENIVDSIENIESFADLYRFFVILITKFETPKNRK